MDIVGKVLVYEFHVITFCIVTCFKKYNATHYLNYSSIITFRICKHQEKKHSQDLDKNGSWICHFFFNSLHSNSFRRAEKSIQICFTINVTYTVSNHFIPYTPISCLVSYQAHLTYRVSGYSPDNPSIPHFSGTGALLVRTGHWFRVNADIQTVHGTLSSVLSIKNVNKVGI